MKRLLSLVVIIPLLAACTPDLSGVRRPENSPSQVTSTPEPGSQVTLGQVPAPEVLTVQIYVVDKNVSPEWGIREAIEGWQRAKYTQIIFVKACPADWNIACVTVSEVNNMSLDYAGETIFYTLPRQMVIHLNKKVTWTTHQEKQTTVCHEFGHILGLAHINYTKKTCMWNGGDYGLDWPQKATNLDLKLVDRLGPWEIQKMYDSSRKDVAIPVAPK